MKAGEVFAVRRRGARLALALRAFGRRDLAVDFGLLALGAGGAAGQGVPRARQPLGAAPELVLGAVEFLTGAGFRRRRPLEGLAGAFVECALAPVQFVFPLVERGLPRVREALT